MKRKTNDDLSLDDKAFLINYFAYHDAHKIEPDMEFVKNYMGR